MKELESDLVPYDGSFRVGRAPARPPKDAPDEKECRRRLEKSVARISEMQEILYAHDSHALLLIFQGMDASGKDGTIRAVLSGVNPAGCQVFSFKTPSPEELDHDFLWRTTRCLPGRGRIGVFNRSHYEEVLVVRVHPEYLERQNLPAPLRLHKLWDKRFESIRSHERHLARQGTVILKFWLNVSKQEQRRRFVSRLEDPAKMWKYSEADVAERRHWREYMKAYEDALRHTSRPWAPWYAIPADDKPYMRMRVAAIVAGAMERLRLKRPAPDAAQRASLARMRKLLDAEP